RPAELTPVAVRSRSRSRWRKPSRERMSHLGSRQAESHRVRCPESSVYHTTGVAWSAGVDLLPYGVMRGVLTLGSVRWRCAAAVGVALGFVAACGSDDVVGRKRPNASSDAAAPGGQAGADSGVGGSNAGGRASTGGRTSTGGGTSTGGVTAHKPCTNSL